MADDRKKVGKTDSDSVSADEGYELAYFARKHGITPDQAVGLVAEHGNNRARLDAAVEEWKKTLK